MPVDTAPELRLGVAREDLTGLAGLALAAGLRADAAVCRASGLRAVPDSRRLGEYLGRMMVGALAGLAECARIVGRRLVPQMTRRRASGKPRRSASRRMRWANWEGSGSVSRLAALSIAAV